MDPHPFLDNVFLLTQPNHAQFMPIGPPRQRLAKGSLYPLYTHSIPTLYPPYTHPIPTVYPRPRHVRGTSEAPNTLSARQTHQLKTNQPHKPANKATTHQPTN